jgi:adenylyl cyclase-associated protein
MLQENKPGPYVTEIKDATQFYGNRVIKEFKEKWVNEKPTVLPYLLLGRDKTHVEWVKAFTAIFDDMKQYVMEHHTTGLVWNAKARKIHASSSRACVNGPCYRAYPSPSTRLQLHPLPPVVLRLPRLLLHHLGRRRLLFPQPPLRLRVVVLRQFSPSLIVVQK